jgi:hypothetical protein
MKVETEGRVVVKQKHSGKGSDLEGIGRVSAA